MVKHAHGIRIDKWLWHARFFKSRSLAATAVASGVRLNGTRITKASTVVRPGDELTFKQSKSVRVVLVLGIGERRGPATEAALLYEDKTPPPAGN